MKKIIISIILSILFFAAILALGGCTKTADPMNTIANTAHQQIVAIRESLPPECKTAAIDEQLKAHDGTVESMKAMCNTQKAALNAEKLRWQWAFFGLAAAIGLYVSRKIFK